RGTLRGGGHLRGGDRPALRGRGPAGRRAVPAEPALDDGVAPLATRRPREPEGTSRAGAARLAPHARGARARRPPGRTRRDTLREQRRTGSVAAPTGARP